MPIQGGPTTDPRYRLGFNPDPWIQGAVGVATGALGYMGAREQRASSERVAREQMAFQERMSSTAYQRAMQDMRAAGLNPMLAYQQGGASSPGGAMPRIEDMAAPAINSAMAAKRLTKELQMMSAQKDLLTQQGAKAFAEAQAAHTVATLNTSRSAESNARMNNIDVSTELMGYETNAAKAMSDWWKNIGSKGAAMKYLLPLMQGIMRAAPNPVRR